MSTSNSARFQGPAAPLLALRTRRGTLKLSQRSGGHWITEAAGEVLTTGVNAAVQQVIDNLRSRRCARGEHALPMGSDLCAECPRSGVSCLTCTRDLVTIELEGREVGFCAYCEGARAGGHRYEISEGPGAPSAAPALRA
jgi:hypothetical protein